MKFHHNGKVITLRAIIKFQAPYCPELSKHKCNSGMSLATFSHSRFIMYFKHIGGFTYKVFGYVGVRGIWVTSILPYNYETGRHEEKIHASEVIERCNW